MKKLCCRTKFFIKLVGQNQCCDSLSLLYEIIPYQVKPEHSSLGIRRNDAHLLNIFQTKKKPKFSLSVFITQLIWLRKSILWLNSLKNHRSTVKPKKQSTKTIRVKIRTD